MGERLFFSGKNLQQALLSASRKLGLRPEEIAYSDRTKTQGALKASRAVIEVDADHPRRASRQPNPPAPIPVSRPVSLAAAAPSSAPAPSGSPTPQRRPQSLPTGEGRPPRFERRNPTADLSAEIPVEQLREAAQEAARLLAAVAGARAQPEARVVGGIVEVELAPGLGPAVSLPQESVAAIQHLLPRALRGLLGASASCRVDLGGVRSVREEELRRLALGAAKEAIERGREVTLAPMGAADRRVVHLALREASGIRTESEGSGDTRAVVIRPA
jgi:hypothetical protein